MNMNLLYFCLSSLLIAALPGPAMMLVMQGSIAHGWQRGARITAGILLADAMLLMAVCLGLGGLMVASPKLLWWMNGASSCYLLYLGVKSWWAIRSHQPSLSETDTGVNWKTGFWITIVNPKTIVFLLAYLPQFIQPASEWSETVQLLCLSWWFLLMVAVVMLIYAVAAHQARPILTHHLVHQAMSIGFGGLLIWLGLMGFWHMAHT